MKEEIAHLTYKKVLNTEWDIRMLNKYHEILSLSIVTLNLI